MSRIIGGTAGGRRIKVPQGGATRPTSDRVREALFSSLESQLGSLAGLRVLDLYAGSGALGLEAMSRGAASLTAVESDRRSAQLIRENAETLGIEVTVIAHPVARVLAGNPAAAYDLVLVDPPYPMPDEEIGRCLDLLAEQHWVATGGLVVVERARRSAEPSWPGGWTGVRSRRYGETVLWYVRGGPKPARDRQGEEHRHG